MSSKKLVIFDLDNTLINTRPAAKIGYKQAIYFIAKRFGLYDSRDKLFNHWKRLVQTLHQDSDPLKRRFEYSLKLLLDTRKIPTTYLSESLSIYEHELLDHLEIMAGSRELLQNLKDQGHLIAVATSGDKSEAIKKLKAVDLFSSLDFLVTANEVGRMKPDPLYYTLCIKQAKIKPDRCLVVGDDMTEDLDPAKSLGLKTFLIPPNRRQVKLLSDELASWLSS
jgi:putative hydrolase of the HAD superfamily